MKKNRMKKLLGTVLSAAMLAAALPAAMAADTVETGTPEGWKTWLQNSAIEQADYVVTTSESYTGNASLNITGRTPGFDYSRIYRNVSYEAGATYNYSFYAKGLDDNAWRYILRFSDGEKVQPSIDSSEDAGNGWRRYYGTITAGSAHDRFELFFDECKDFDMNVYFDDFSVTKVGDETNTNIIKNAGFENYTVLKPTLSVSSGDGKLDVSWTNPGARSTDIKLYVGDNQVEVPDLKLYSSQSNAIEVAGLDNFQEYPVRVVCTTAFGVYEDSTVGIPKTLQTGTPDGWSVWFQNDAYKQADYVVTTSDSYSGVASLNISGRTPGFDYSRIYQRVSYEKGATYNYSFLAKNLGDNAWRFLLRLGDGKNAQPGIASSEDVGNNWRRYYGTITAGSGDNRFELFFDECKEFDMNVYFDDLSVTKVGDESNTNILSNAGFESYTVLMPELSVIPGDGKLNVSWKNPGARSTDIKLYVDDNEVEVSDLNTYCGQSNQAELTGLTNGRAYTVKVVCTTAFGVYSDSTAIAPRKYVEGSIENTGWYGLTNEFKATTRASYSGNASLNIKGSIASGSREILQNTEGSYDKSSAYLITVYGKNIPSGKIRVWLGDYYDGLLDLFTKEYAGNGWYKYTYTTTPQTGDDYNLHVAFCDAPDGVDCYLDNLSIVKVGDETNTNIVSNGDFEDYTAYSNGEGVKYGYVEGGYLFWTLDTSCKPTYFNIYKLVNGDRVKVGRTDSGEDTYFEVSDYTEGDRYFVTSVYEDRDIETDGVELKDEVIVSGIFGTGTIAEDGTIADFKEIKNIQTGDILAGAEIINNTASEINPEVYIALYADGRLAGVQKLSANIAGRDLDGNAGTAELAASVHVPEGQTCSIKVMTWKNGVLNPFAGAQELK